MAYLKQIDEYFGVTEWLDTIDGKVHDGVSAEDQRWIRRFGYAILALIVLFYIAILSF